MTRNKTGDRDDSGGIVMVLGILFAGACAVFAAVTFVVYSAVRACWRWFR